MAKRRSFVPECLISSSLEGRLVLSTFDTIGNWFSSQYSHVKQDLGITHKNPNAASGASSSSGMPARRRPSPPTPPTPPAPLM